MEKPRNDARLAAVSSGFAEGMGITLADKGWAAYGEGRAPRRTTGTSEGRRRQLAQRPPPIDQDSPWQAADRALAEIAAANRNEALEAGKDRAVLERATAAVRDSLLEAAQAAAEAAHRARALAEALDDAMSALNADQGQAPVPAPTPTTISIRRAPRAQEADSLSQREREVLSWVAEGRSNKAIAEELYVSPNTVKTHVASLLRKLNAHSRAQLATIAVQQGFVMGAR